MSDLQRFIDAQNYNYQSALEEIKNGRKTSCWMWYVFPQICGLGYSQMGSVKKFVSLEENDSFLVRITI